MPSEIMRHTRKEGQHKDLSERFFLPSSNRQFNRQYAHIYASRLWAMRPKIESAAKETWGSSVVIRQLSDLNTDEECVIIGTLFKNQKLKPSVLKELGEELSITPQPLQDKYVDESDEICLEDDLQRIVLTGVDVGKLLTGIVVAAYGLESSDNPGKFQVEKPLIFYPLPKQDKLLDLRTDTSISRPLPLGDMKSDDKYIVLMSGLDLGSKSVDSLSLQLLIDLLTGQLGDANTQAAMANVVRVVVAGNSLARETRDRESANKAKYLTKKSEVASKDAVSTLDEVLVQLAASMEVDVMPGEFDPANFTMPQQPLHRCLLPLSHHYSTMRCVTNPYMCTVNDLTILGTSGQPVQDIYRFSTLEDHLDILEKTLTMGHLCPTSPDTLACYPYADTDPFIMDVCPHIYFSGNAPQLSHKVLKGVDGQTALLVTVPRFSVTHSCVAVNLSTLECHEIRVDVSSIESENNSDSMDVDN